MAAHTFIPKAFFIFSPFWSKCDKLASIFNHPILHVWLKSNILKIEMFLPEAYKQTKKALEPSEVKLHIWGKPVQSCTRTAISVTFPLFPFTALSSLYRGCFYWVWQLAVFVNIKEAHAKCVKIWKFTVRSSKALWDVQPLLLVNYD